MRKDRPLVVLVALLMLAFVLVFWFFPRSTYSELEKRDLRQFPEFSWQSLCDGSFTSDVSNWFSDSEPFRDVFMTGSMRLKSWMTISWFANHDKVTFHAPAPEEETVVEEEEIVPPQAPVVADQRNIQKFQSEVPVQAKMENSGVIVVGSAPTARALMAFNNKKGGEKGFAKVVNLYQETFGPDVNVYCMVIPTATEFYCPESARSCSQSEFLVLSDLYAQIDSTVRVVDVYMALRNHVNEDIYLRTDHHWSPLGAYYAARQFAMVAGVKVPELEEYEPRTIKGFVGSMYGYSKDITVKKSPEDFVYYTPRDVNYSTTYRVYTLDKDYRITGEKKARKGDFFVAVSNTSSAYCTFMGSDVRITQVKTDADSDRRLLVLKDSFGNAIPGYLFDSFEEIHVVDFRYFTYNIKDYVDQNGITDILMANNISQVCSGAIGAAYKKFLVN
jgi:hypothetical protein